jgi:DNA-binding HxlR family transcriptional regulator
VHPDSSVRVEYELTPMGRALAPAMKELKAWADQWLC